MVALLKKETFCCIATWVAVQATFLLLLRFCTLKIHRDNIGVYVVFSSLNIDCDQCHSSYMTILQRSWSQLVVLQCGVYFQNCDQSRSLSFTGKLLSQYMLYFSSLNIDCDQGRSSFLNIFDIDFVTVYSSYRMSIVFS